MAGKETFEVTDNVEYDSFGNDKLQGESAAAEHVPEKYRGTASDRRDMTILGKKQVLRRNFKFFTLVGFASTVGVTWEYTPVISMFALADGGTAIVFWGMIMSMIGFSMVYASLAELASMSPTAGGQYHWVSEFAPPRFQKPLSYFVGWLLAIGWNVYLADVTFIVAGMIQGMIKLNNDSYQAEPYQQTLLTIAIILFAAFFNTVLAVRLPLIEGIMLFLHVAGLFAIIIPLWVMAPRGNVHDTLLVFSQESGWPSLGLAAMIGLANVAGMPVGYDCSVHMAEEVQDASENVPKSMLWSVIINMLMWFTMGVTYIFTLGDQTEIWETPTDQPFLAVFYNATKSRGGTSVMASILVIMIISSSVSEVATASRQLWSFARDGGLPASKWLAHVPPGWNIPLRSVFVTVVVVALLSLINLGSTVALNAINSLGGLSVMSSYLVTISCLIWRRLFGEELPPRRWSLGNYGLAINIGAIIWVLPVTFFLVWPLATPVTASTMNFASIIFAVVIALATIYYFVKARYEYSGPVVLVKRHDM